MQARDERMLPLQDRARGRPRRSATATARRALDAAPPRANARRDAEHPAALQPASRGPLRNRRSVHTPRLAAPDSTADEALRPSLGSRLAPRAFAQYQLWPA